MPRFSKLAFLAFFKKTQKMTQNHIFGKLFFHSSIRNKITFHLICHMIHVEKSENLTFLVLKKLFFKNKIEKKIYLKKSKKVVLGIQETRLV